ncbi:MAG: T9SS type A sorting domain-containing protein, partial [Hymenobacter sp.]
SLEGTNVPASAATDGDHTTRWSSQFSDPQYIYVDLGSVQTVDRVRLTWETAYGKNFTIDVSNDATTWTTVKTVVNNSPVTANNLYVNEYERLNATGRYVRMYGTARATGYGYSIFELEVFGYSNPLTSLATSKAGTASDTEGNLAASLAFDGDSTTRWSTMTTTNQWVYVDLNGLSTISRVYLNWERAWGISYLIQVSNDASTWTTVATVTNNQAYYNELSLPSGTSGRYVRMYGQTGGQNGGGFSLWEFKVYGTQTASKTVTPLPVTLTSFGAVAQGTGVAVSWATASEQHNAGFEVQRSGDGTAFTALGTVSGGGTTLSAHTYSYFDASPLAGTAYYRLKQLDSDGTFTYSPVAAVQAAPSSPAASSIYPNPTTERTTVTWEVPLAGAGRWYLTNSLGQVVHAEALSSEITAALLVDLQSYPAGSYVLTVEASGKVVRRGRVQKSN